MTAEAVVAASKARMELSGWVEAMFPWDNSSCSFLSFDVATRQATPGTNLLPVAVRSILVWDMVSDTAFCTCCGCMSMLPPGDLPPLEPAPLPINIPTEQCHMNSQSDNASHIYSFHVTAELFLCTRVSGERPVSHSVATWCMSCLYQGGLESSLPQTTPLQMRDLLYIAVNHREFGVPTLLMHDKQHTHVLHGDISDSSLVDSRAQLIEHLCITSIMSKATEVIRELAATPAAQNLSPAAALHLLYLALDNEAEEKTLMSLDKAKAPLVAAVLEVPSARAVDAFKLGNLMHYAMKKQRPGTVAIFSTLPQAHQLPPKQLCELLIAAGIRAEEEQRYAEDNWEQKQSDRELVQRLAALDSGKHLAPGDAFRLLESALEHVWGPNISMRDVLEDLGHMRLGSQLTGSELLQLMLLATKDGNSDCSVLSGVQPAVHRIDDEAGYVEFLLEAIRRRVDPDVVEIVANDVP